MTDPLAPANPRSSCAHAGCGGKLVLADDGRWHHLGAHGAGLHTPVAADPTPAEEAAYRQGLEAGLTAVRVAMDADPHADHADGLAVVAQVASGYGLQLPPINEPTPPEPAPGSAADRLSWSSAEGLIITPPPVDPS